jgi:hypothetical protein
LDAASAFTAIALTTMPSSAARSAAAAFLSWFLLKNKDKK